MIQTATRCVLAFGVLLAGCTKVDPEQLRPEAVVSNNSVQGAPSAAVVKPASSTAAAPSKRVEWIEAPADADFASSVRLERAKAQRAGRMLVVYVGADWCPPCKAFHEAVAAGTLDESLGKITFLVFDFDRDASKMGAFGYQTTHIPFFVKPGPDGAPDAAFNIKTLNKPAAVQEATNKLMAWLNVH